MRMTAQPTMRRAFGARVAIGALAVALLVTVGTANGVGAERPPSGGDSHQQGCRAIYDRSEQLRAEYKQVGIANPGSARLDEILAELRTLASNWESLHCDDRYGSVATMEHLPDGSWAVDLTGETILADPVMSVSDPLLTESPAGQIPAGEVVEITDTLALTESATTNIDAEDVTVVESSVAPVVEPVVEPGVDPATEPVVAVVPDAAPVDEAIDAGAEAPATAAVESVAEPVEGQE